MNPTPPVSAPAGSTPPASGFAGLRVVNFEARMAGPMADLIRKHGGVPVAAPALREVPIGDNPRALDFAAKLISGEFDVVIFLTGVGTRYLTQEIETRYPRDEWLAALGRDHRRQPWTPSRSFLFANSRSGSI